MQEVIIKVGPVVGSWEPYHDLTGIDQEFCHQRVLMCSKPIREVTDHKQGMCYKVEYQVFQEF